MTEGATPMPPAPVHHPLSLYIGGEWVEPSASTTIDVFDSATEEVFLTVAEAQAPDVDRAVAAARDAFDNGPWPRLSHAERAEYVKRIADGWIARSAELAACWTAESGVLASLSGYVAHSVAAIYRFHAGLAETYPWIEKRPSILGADAVIVHEPVGVVAAIVPWNGPASLIATKCAPALVAGCTVVVKASPEAPAAAYLLAEICEEIGLPAGVINIITADREVSELLVRHPGVDKISFTGSTAAGSRIATVSGDRIARLTLELGGKSAGLILDDFDVAEAAKILAQSTCVLSGQVCAALTRIIVREDRHEALAQALADEFGKLKLGDPRDPETQMGPLASRRQRDRVESYLVKGKANGVRLMTGGGRPAHLERGFYIEPTIFANVDNRSIIAREEIFGPVLCVIPAEDEAEMIAIANDSIFGLNAGVFTHSADRAFDVGRKLRAGMISHNGYATDWTLPGGGWKQSGLGREGGIEGLEGFTELKTMKLRGAISDHN